MPRKTPTEDVIVIGAGPAGLALAHSLGKRGIDPLLLEAGDAPGWSWSNMPRNITLLSPWKVNHLPGTTPTITDRHAMHTCHEFAAYLRNYAANHRFRIETGVTVKKVKDKAGAFELQTSAGLRRARKVVCASGYFAKPRMPRYHGMRDTNVRQIHVQEFRSAAETYSELGVQSPRVLIVGRRISAGQTLAELHDANLGFDVVLSRRGPVTFAQPPWLLKLSFWLYYRWEDAKVAADPFSLDDTFPPMEGGREKAILDAGLVRQVPDIARFHADEVELVDNTRERFDLVIYTTGFLPALDYLGKVAPIDPSTGLPPLHRGESIDVPGLYFLGMDKQRSFRSRYLRGIREDAVYLADDIAAAVDRHRSAA